MKILTYHSDGGDNMIVKLRSVYSSHAFFKKYIRELELAGYKITKKNKPEIIELEVNTLEEFVDLVNVLDEPIIVDYFDRSKIEARIYDTWIE